MNREALKKRIITVAAFCILLIPFLSIVGIKNAISSEMYQAWQIVAMAILGVVVIVKAKDIKLNWAIAIFAVYQFVIAASSVMNNGLSMGIIMSIVVWVLLFTLLQTDYYHDIILAISIIVVVSLALNIPGMINNLDVPNVEFFIGGKNALGIFLVPGVFFMLIRSYESNGTVSKLTMAVALIALVVVFAGSSGTGIIVAASTVLFLIISQKIKLKKWIFMGAIMTVYAIFIFFPEDFFITEYWLNFTDYLGKDVSLTLRTRIWQEAAALVSNNWLFGAGRGVEITYIGSIGKWQTTYEAHNFFLEILMEGGLVALALYAVLFFKAVKGLDMSNKAHKLAFIALCIIMINGLTESTVNNFFVVAMLGVACRFASEKVDSRDDNWIADSKS